MGEESACLYVMSQGKTQEKETRWCCGVGNQDRGTTRDDMMAAGGREGRQGVVERKEPGVDLEVSAKDGRFTGY